MYRRSFPVLFLGVTILARIDVNLRTFLSVLLGFHNNDDAYGFFFEFIAHYPNNRLVVSM